MVNWESFVSGGLIHLPGMTQENHKENSGKLILPNWKL
jgi:hypothetical protein